MDEQFEKYHCISTSKKRQEAFLVSEEYKNALYKCKCERHISALERHTLNVYVSEEERQLDLATDLNRILFKDSLGKRRKLKF